MTVAFDPAAARGTPLVEDDVQQLKQLLDSHAVPHGGMSLEMADGLFSALIVGPGKVAPERFLPLLLGGGDWPADARDTAIGLLSRLWAHIEARIGIDPESGELGFMPLYSVPAGLPDDPGEYIAALTRSRFPLGAGWAGGFLHAVQLGLDDWRRLETAVPQVNAGIDLLIRLVQLEVDDEGNLPPTSEQRVAMVTAMPHLLRALALRKAQG
jgi:yecA family protein